MKQTFILFLSLLISIVAVAQNNFKQGYIITNTNDSIIGLIDFRIDETNSQFCSFKTDEKAPVQLFYPDDIAKYRFINEGKYYVSHSVTIGNNTYKVFLEYLISGMMNLYYHKNPVSKQEYYFFEDKTGEIIPVTKRPDQIVDMKVVSDSRYIGVLNFLFNDYPTLQKDINSSNFAKSSMINIAKKYHALTCTTGDECIDFENDYKRKYVRFKLSVYGGLKISNYYFNKNEELLIFKSTSSLFPVIGGQINISSPRLTNMLNFIVDISFSGIKGEKDVAIEDDLIYKKYNFNALVTNERINLMFIYPTRKFRPMFDAGFSHYTLFNKSSLYYTENTGHYNGKPKHTPNVYKNNDISPEPAFWGFNYGTGFDYLIGNDRVMFCRLSFERVKNINVIKSTQLKLGITF